MRECPTCRKDIADGGARFCPDDGAALPDSPSASEPGVPLDALVAPTPPPAQSIVLSTGDLEDVAHPPPLPPPDPLLERTLDGRYRILSAIGQGGMGAVYLAEHVEIGKRVALKVLRGPFADSEPYRRRFEREARAASKLAHPASVAVLDFGRIAAVEPADAAGAELVGTPYLVMEFVAGETLSRRLARGPMDAGEAVILARNLLSAMRHAHELGVVHRDIKPANVLLPTTRATGVVVKLLDFGLAKVMSDEEAVGSRGEPITEAGMVCGTPAYLSPEQAEGRKATAQSDLYSLGVTLFEMLCGRTPFAGATSHSVIFAHLNTPPPRPRSIVPSLSPELEAVVLRALEKAPAARWASAEEMQAALARCPEATVPGTGEPATHASAPPSSTPPTTASTPTAKRARLGKLRPLVRDRRLLVGGVALLLALAGALVVAVGRHAAPASPVAALAGDAPGSAATKSAPSAAATRARTLVERGRSDAALAAARAAVAHDGADAMAHAVLGAAYQQKLWCSDAIDEFERALHLDGDLAADPLVARSAIACLRGRAQPRAVRFIVDRLGSAATEAVRAAATADPDAEVRQGAARALAALHK